MKTFLSQVTHDLISRIGWDRLSSCTIVFPMHRAGLFMKQYIADAIQAEGLNKPVVLPRFLTIDELADSFCPLRGDDEIRAVCRLYTCYRKHAQLTLDMDSFYGWGLQLLTDFSAADMALVPVAKLLDHAAAAQQLDATELDDDTRQRLLSLLGDNGQADSIRRFYADLWQAVPAIYKDFTAQQTAEGVASRGARTRWVVEHPDEWREQTAGRTFVFVGFNYLLTAERELMRLLQKEASALFYFDHDTTFTLDKGVYAFIDENIKEFPNSCSEHLRSRDAAFRLRSGSAAFCSPSITAIAAQSASAQAHYVHEWLLEHYRPGRHTAVVLADESMLSEVIYALPEGDPFRTVNITKGYPLRDTPVFADVVRFLSDANRQNQPPLDVLRSLQQYIDGSDHRVVAEEEAYWQAVLAAEAYYQTQNALSRLLLLLETDAEVLAEVKTVKTLRNLVARALETISIPFHGEPITDIQLIGVLETRLLDFDDVLILNVEEGVVPNTAVDHSFLPYDLRKLYHMQTRDEEAKIYAYNFFRLLRRASTITMLFSEAGSDTGKKQMSRFLMQLLASPDYAVSKKRLTEAAVMSEVTPVCTSFDTPQAPSHLSPSALSDFIECPREYYLKHIAHIYPVEAETTLFSPSELGSLVHATLEAAYLQICGSVTNEQGEKHLAPGEHAVKPEQIQAWLDSENRFNQALAEGYAFLNANYLSHKTTQGGLSPMCSFTPYVPEAHSAENHVVRTFVRTILKKDAALSGLRLLYMEKELRLPISLADCPASFYIKGTIDRLDRVEEDGTARLRVVDYKTGGFDEKKMSFSNYDELFEDSNKRYILQTLIYCRMVLTEQQAGRLPRLPISPRLLYPRNPSADPFLYLPNGDKLVDYAGQCAVDFEPVLDKNLKTILTTSNFSPAEQKDCEDSHCYCAFHSLCNRKKKEY